MTDRDIRSLVRRGRARTVLEVGRDCSAGHGCGGCRIAIEQIVRQEERSRTEAVLPSLAPAI